MPLQRLLAMSIHSEPSTIDQVAQRLPGKRMVASGKIHAALVLAGSRPGGDPLAEAMGVRRKALIPIEGKPMLLWVLDALRGAGVDRIALCGLDESDIASNAALRSHAALANVELVPSRDTPSRSVLHAMRELRQLPLLVTTADHPLLTADIVDFFCRQAVATDADVAIGLVTGESVRSAYPLAQRTFLRFRDATYCGCNLYAFLSQPAERAVEHWARVEAHRKKPWRMVKELGPGVLLRFLLHRLSLADTVQLVSERMAVQARTVLLPSPDAALDVDKIRHLEMAAEILRARERA